MSAQIPINRESTTTTLLDRYNKQHVGGAFDAKAIATSDHVPIIDSMQSAQWTPSGFKVAMNASEFNDKALNIVDKSGWNNDKYKP